MRTTKFTILASLVSLSIQDEEKLALIDRTRPLVPMAEYTPPSDFDNNPKLYYPNYYRVLNCWECFEAEGKICMDSGHNSLYHHTKSSDPGSAFCCKPDSDEGYCKHGAAHDHEGEEEGIESVCSQPSKGGLSKYSSILTSGKNHQMFAFCPAINHKKCGITSSSQGSTDMGLKAGIDKVTVKSNEMRYKKATPQDQSREYDACYYEITMDKSVLDKYNPKEIKVTITAKSNMNVYVYGGRSRLEATDSVISGNQQASSGATYSIGADKGFLIVAYPNEVVKLEPGQTDFGFDYWLDADLIPEEDDAAVPVILNDSGSNKIVIEKDDNGADKEEPSPEEKGIKSILPGQENDLLFYGLCAAAGILLVAIIVLCIKCRKKGKITQHGNQDSNLYPANMTGERSLHLEEMDEEDYKNPNDTNRPSLGGKENMVYGDSDKLP